MGVRVLSLYWLVAALTCFIASVALATVGYVVPRLLPFTEALLASLFGVFIALGIAILVIEGTLLTRLGRRDKIIARTSKAIISDAAEKISWSTLGLGRWMGSVLPEEIIVDEEINAIQDPHSESSVNPVLRKVFQRAQQVRATDIKIAAPIPIPVDEYERTIAGTKDLVRDIRLRVEGNLDVHEQLLELSDALGDIEQVLIRCWWPVNIREEDNRFRCLGQLGTACVQSVLAFPSRVSGPRSR